MIVIELPRLEGAMKVIEHLLPASMQLFGEKVPPAPPSLHDIMPIIDDAGFAVSMAAAVTVTLLPGVTVVDDAFTVVVVESSVLVDM